MSWKPNLRLVDIGSEISGRPSRSQRQPRAKKVAADAQARQVEKKAPWTKEARPRTEGQANAIEVSRNHDIAFMTIEVAPLAFLRGRTLSHAFIVLDEAQNATAGQIKMVVTRLGEGSRMVLSGDPTQHDLDEGDSGLAEMASVLDVEGSGVGVARLDKGDVVRHRTVSRVLEILEAAA
jgi:phosphate starvation-inducible PhoH-like protein